MRAKCVMPDEQFRLVTECRQSGLSDYQWCQMHDVKPGTFYNWISRLRKKGYAVPKPNASAAPATGERQEVVRVNLIPDQAGTSFPSNLTELPQNRVSERSESPAAEIVIGGATVRFFSGADQEMVRTVISCFGGGAHAW